MSEYEHDVVDDGDGEDSEADLKRTRRRLDVHSRAPALSIDFDGYVRAGLSGKMDRSDRLLLGLVMCMSNKAWCDRIVEKVDREMAGCRTDVDRVVRAVEMIKGVKV